MRDTVRYTTRVAAAMLGAAVIIAPPAPLVAVPTSAGGVAAAPAQNTTTTVFLVRHAEKAAPGDPEFDADTPADPPLNSAGRERAEALARTLAEAGVTAIYASEFGRTQQTVEPLAAHVGVAVTVHPAADTPGLVERVRRHRGGVVVIAGHSNTVPDLVEALGAPAVPPIEEAWEYDNLYFVTVEDIGRARVSTLKFGASSR